MTSNFGAQTGLTQYGMSFWLGRSEEIEKAIRISGLGRCNDNGLWKKDETRIN